MGDTVQTEVIRKVCKVDVIFILGEQSAVVEVTGGISGVVCRIFRKAGADFNKQNGNDKYGYNNEEDKKIL